VDKNWGIGCENKLLFHLPEDLKRFRRLTVGKVVVMGRKTLESLPGGVPLKNRTNIVLSRNKNLKIPGAIVCNSTEDLLKELEKYDEDDIFIIGGQAVYIELIEHCRFAYVTKINAESSADVFFPNVDEMLSWMQTEETESKEHEGIKYVFCLYERKA